MGTPTLSKRYPVRALAAGARWLLNPVSEGGAKQMPRMLLYATGVETLAGVEQMREHPTGKRILSERPDLAAILSNPVALARMPPGSFGRAFHDAMSKPGGVPGYLLAGLIYRDGFFDRYQMPDDARYVIERYRWLHDLIHVLTGYKTDLAGEGLLIFFDFGYRHSIPLRFASVTPMGLGPFVFIRPDMGQRRWRGLLRDAYAHGEAAKRRHPPMSVYWEEMLPRPLKDVREELGIVPFEEDTSEWLSGSWIGRNASTGFGAYKAQAEQARLAQRVVEAGVDFRDLMRASPASAAELRRLAEEGVDDDTIRAAAARLLASTDAGRRPGPPPV
jgi:ubiquinone biosynthesis protein Coq4